MPIKIHGSSMLPFAEHGAFRHSGSFSSGIANQNASFEIGIDSEPEDGRYALRGKRKEERQVPSSVVMK
jgi:hypothetical protein